MNLKHRAGQRLGADVRCFHSRIDINIQTAVKSDSLIRLVKQCTWIYNNRNGTFYLSFKMKIVTIVESGTSSMVVNGKLHILGI